MIYRPDIDGLRTLAVLLVLVFHFDLLAFGKAGFIGVDIFFVTSGFLITSIIRRDLELGRFNFGSFLYRRIRRLYPALLATLTMTLLAGWFLLLPHRFEELAKETFLSLLYVVNIYFWRSINYFGLQAGSVPLLHMWSLAIEEQFYIIFPLVCAAVWRRNARALLPIILAGAFISFVLALTIAPLRPELAFYLLPTRAWELLLGSALSLIIHGRTLEGRWLHWMGPLGFGLVGASIALYGPLTHVPGLFSLLPTIGAVFFLIGGSAEQAPVTRFMSNMPMVWIGKISYPLYLVHWPILILIKEHVYEFSYVYRLAGFLLSFGIAALVFYVFEKPIREGIVLKSRRWYLFVVAALSLGGVAASAAIVMDDGVPSRFDPAVHRYLAARHDKPTRFEGCERQFTSVDQLCRLGEPAHPREVMVVGDSHAHALSGALDIWLKRNKRGGVLVFYSGCMPVLGAGRPRCEHAIQKALEAARDNPSIREVILVSIWRQALPGNGQPFLGRWVPAADVPRVFDQQLQKTVSMLKLAGKRVIIVDPLFAAPKFVPETLAGNVAFQRHWKVDVPLAEHQKTFAPVLDAFDRLQGVQRISLLGPLCDRRICRAIVDGQPLFVDNNHVAQVHSNLLASTIDAQRK